MAPSKNEAQSGSVNIFMHAHTRALKYIFSLSPPPFLPSNFFRLFMNRSTLADFSDLKKEIKPASGERRKRLASREEGFSLLIDFALLYFHQVDT